MVANVSIFVSKGISSVVVSSNGKRYYTAVERIIDSSTAENRYLAELYAFNRSLRLLRQFLNENIGFDEAVFEVSSRTFIGWVEKQFAGDEYNEIFNTAMQELHSIPIKYSFMYNKKPKAAEFADKRFCNKSVVGGLL